MYPRSNSKKTHPHQRHRRPPPPPPPPPQPPTATVSGSSEPDLSYPERWIGPPFAPKRVLLS
ncbi:hypothetical protein BVC80_1591g2 [Macleaya cordata]|uniref:Uncharacterized protein n=1 Tax=Macleaya cordata TaxID=56857 RepID=A0A200QI44_MACCD|nr:hypothetical protein BVC80_1591g2 [Macleaya cordata]